MNYQGKGCMVRGKSRFLRVIFVISENKNGIADCGDFPAMVPHGQAIAAEISG